MKPTKENFIRQIEEMKKANKLDLSVGEDLSIAIMNVISLEEHFLFSYMKTENDKFLEFLEEVREIRKKLLAKIVKRGEGDYSEKWCISKHLLATAMRLNEIGTKYLHDGNKKEAEEIFTNSFNTYNLFWAVNGFVKLGDGKKVGKSKMSKISQIMKKMLDCCKE
jgi:hypothetical protein